MEFTANKKYSVIYADPGWQYRSKRTGGSMLSGAMQKYNTMPLADLCALPIKDIVEKNALLCLWVTSPLKYEVVVPLLTTWGFEYKAAIYWIKLAKRKPQALSFGLGHYLRNTVEELIIAIRGKIKPPRIAMPNAVMVKIQDHSVKPPYFRDQVDEMADRMELSNRRLELFARERAEGWDSIGQAINGKDIRETLCEKLKTIKTVGKKH